MRKLSILHICSSLAWGGAEMSAVKLAGNFMKRGQNILFAAHPRGQIMKELLSANIEAIPIRLLRNFDPISVYTLVRILKKRNIDIVHVHMSRDLVHVFLALKFVKHKPPVVLQKQVSSKVIKKDYFHKKIYSRVSRIFVLSNFLRENVLHTCPVTNDKVVVIPGGIDLSKYRTSVEVRERLRMALKIPPSCIVFGTIARIDRGKGLSELVQAFSRLVNQNADIRLIIVGEPTAGETAYADELNKLIAELRIQSSVLFTGFRSDIPNILSTFDVFVLASYGEAFGYVLLEASAARLPIITTDAGGVRDIVEDGKTGILVHPNDVDSLYGAMENLIMDSSLREQFGFAGQKRIEEKFIEEDILAKIESEYLSLLEG